MANTIPPPPRGRRDYVYDDRQLMDVHSIKRRLSKRTNSLSLLSSPLLREHETAAGRAGAGAAAASTTVSLPLLCGNGRRRRGRAEVAQTSKDYHIVTMSEMIKGAYNINTYGRWHNFVFAAANPYKDDVGVESPPGQKHEIK